MNAIATTPKSEVPSAAGLARMREYRLEPLFLADWERVLMMHFEVDAEQLQGEVPFELDLWNGRAFVSLVAFTMHGMRPRFGGKLTESLFRPIATHDFLNVRTYVRHHGEPGIHFLAEWLLSWLAVKLGPTTFGLPYRHGQIDYRHDVSHCDWRGRVEDVKTAARLEYRAVLETDCFATPQGMHRSFESRRAPSPQPSPPRGRGSLPLAAMKSSGGERSGTGPSYAPCDEGSLDEWLMERYTAYNAVRGKRYFRVWHPPWPQCPAEVTIEEDSLLAENWPFWKRGRLVGANASTGVHDVWLGWPHRLK